MREVTRQLARVAWHGNGGYTKVMLEANGTLVDVPTADIPYTHRRIGCRFLLIVSAFDREELQGEENFRKALRFVFEVRLVPDSVAE